MDSPEQENPQPLTSPLLSPSEARAVEPSIPAPDSLAREELKANSALRSQRQDQGVIGWIFGSRLEKPGNIAAVVIFLSFALIFLVYWRAGITETVVNNVVTQVRSEPLSEPFFKLFSALAGIIGLALGYLFGSSNKN